MPKPGLRIAMLWSLLMNVGEQGLHSGFTIVLGVWLGPEVFGSVTMALVYVSFIDLVLDQGLTTAIIQRPDLDDRTLDTAFWLVCGLSILLALASVAGSGAWARYNGVPALQPMVWALSVMLPLTGLTTVQRAILQREMDFRSLAVRSNVSVLLGGIAGLVLASLGAGYWSFIGQHVVKAVAALALLWSLARWRPRLRFSLEAARSLSGFAGGAFVARLGFFVNNRADAVLMGGFFGPTTLGIYRLADRAVSLLSSLSARSVQAVALPEFSRLQADPEKLIRSLLFCLRLSGALILPWLAVLAAARHDVTAWLDPDWQQGTEALGLLCVVGMCQAMTVLTGPLMRGVGRPWVHSLFVWIQAAPSAGIIVLAARLVEGGTPAVESATVAGLRAALFGLIFLPLNWAIPIWLCRVRVRDLVKAVGPAVTAALAGAGVALATEWGLPSSVPVLARAPLVVAPAGLVALACLLLLDAEASGAMRQLSAAVQRKNRARTTVQG